MRVIAVSLWMFICMTVVGVVGYTYLLWVQYWKSLQNRKFVHQPRDLQLQELNVKLSPVLPSQGPKEMQSNFTVQKAAISNFPLDKLLSKVMVYKNQLIIQLRQNQLDGTNVIYLKNKENPYKVHYSGRWASRFEDSITSNQLLCDLKDSVRVKMLSGNVEPFYTLGFSSFFPTVSFSESIGHFNTCAIISSSGSLYKSGLGKEIDNHDAVLRFNNAPTAGYENDVGTKTTLRILNSQVISKPEFNFMESEIYKNITLVAWDPSNYYAPLDEWYMQPDFDLFTPYWERRKEFPREAFYILNPEIVWKSWDFLQKHTHGNIMKNPPSSGFIGLVIMHSICDWIDLYEYVPSMRLTKRCHYYDIHNDIGCSFGNWHPLSTEKLMTLRMNVASDVDVMAHGKVTIKGSNKITCK